MAPKDLWQMAQECHQLTEYLRMRQGVGSFNLGTLMFMQLNYGACIS